MIKLQITILLLLLFTIQAHKKQKCSHDSDKRHQKFYEDLKKHINSNPRQRNLQNQKVNSQPIRITVDYSMLNNNPITPKQKDYLIRQVETAKLYFQKLLKVNQIRGNNIYPRGWGDDCLGVIIPQIAQTQGIPNSDLHLYVIHKDSESDGDLANAAACAYDDDYLRPTYGRIEFNLAYVGKNDDPETFENDLETTVHETLHVLGFSGWAMQFWIDPETGDYYDEKGLDKITKTISLRGKPTGVIFSKNVLETGRKYYNCPTMEGMQLENEGGSGSLGSHWEQVLVQNEMMMSSDVITDAQLSVHTIALLKDTGYYTEVNENMADNLYWGKGKGCDFVTNGCYSKQSFSEFPKKAGEVKCSFENDGYGSSRTTAFMDNCNMQSIYGNKLCSSYKNNGQDDAPQRLEYFGQDSKCFTSTATDGSYRPSDNNRCHQFKCSEDMSSITITISTKVNVTLVCRNPGEQLDIAAAGKSYGKISCPENFEQFCDYAPICPKFCGAHGVCVRGTCLCNAGWSGVDCLTKCDDLEEGGRCVSKCSSGKLVNPNKSCQVGCPKGYYSDSRQCQQCHIDCRECNGESNNSCTLCQFMTLLQDNKCVRQCSAGYKANAKGTKCETQSQSTSCSNGCKTCDQNNKSFCFSCNPNQYLSDNSCVSSCLSGSYGSNGACKPCIKGCAQCKNDSECQACDVESGYKSQNGKCVNCSSQCETCFESDPRICQTCPANKILTDQGSCIDSCESGTFLDKKANKCRPCIYNCKQCSNLSNCNQCEDGYVFTNDQCQRNTTPISNCLQKTCQQCPASKNVCIDCAPGWFLLYSQCYQQCPAGFYADSRRKICSPCQQGTINQGCAVCSNNVSCSQCETGYSLINGVCVVQRCGLSNCEICGKNSACDKCKIGYVLQNSQCVNYCSSGFFEDNRVCKPCNSKCKECDLDQNYCTRCVGAFAYQGECVSKCPNGTRISGACN